MKPNYLSPVVFGLGVSAAVLEQAPGKCCFNIIAIGGGRSHYWRSPIWQEIDGAFQLGGGGDDKKLSKFCFNYQDRSLTDSSGRKCHAQKETGQLHCLHNPLECRSSILSSAQNEQAANIK